MRNRIKAILLLAAFLLSLQCASGVSVVISRHENPDEIRRIAIFKIEHTGRYRYRAGEWLSDLLIHEFLRLGYDVVERAQVDHLIKEQKLSVSGFINPKEAVAIGKLAGADTIVIGNIQLDEKDSEVLQHMIIKIISLKSGSVIITINVTKKMKIQDAVSEVYKALKKSLDERKMVKVPKA